MPSLEEQDLVKRAKMGDQDAFGALMTQYQKPIYNLTLRMSKKAEDAEELTQTAFLKAWRALPGFQEDASFFTWLYRLATNACIDHLRRESRRQQVLHTVSLDDEEAPTLPIADFRNAPEERVLQQDLRDTISKALDELSSEHREILIQREIDGLSYGEIAELMELELGTVKSRIARARLALRQVLLRDGNFFEKTPSDKVKEAKGGDVR